MSASAGALFGLSPRRGEAELALRAGSSGAPTSVTNPLLRLQFRNSGIVRRQMQFQFVDQPANYAEDSDHWNIRDKAQYLFQLEAGRKTSPPNGMRSAVPLGGLGSGTVELRADGSLRDWELFNNSPAGGTKIQIDDTFFGIWTKLRGQSSNAQTLRTHPPGPLPPVSQIEYAGAFPVSRLRFSDPQLSLAAELYAYSEFHPFDADASCTPCALFSFVLHNPTQDAMEASLLFLVRNYARGRATVNEGVRFEKSGTEPTSGTLAVGVVGEPVSISGGLSSDLTSLWNEFSSAGDFTGRTHREVAPAYGGLAAKTALPAGATQTITFVLAWHFPNRTYLHQTPGNHYANLYRDAQDVADQALRRLDSTWAAISTWQQTLFDNSLPDWLQDALINSVATMYKTGVWFREGTLQQWESFSCAGLNPGHIDFYRNLPYALFFPALNQDLLEAHAQSQDSSGFIPEQLTTGCFAPESELGHPGGRAMGDSETVFVLWAWQIYAWTGDKQCLDRIWPKVKKAAGWQIQRSTKYGLPAQLENTYDWWQFGDKDLVAYNAFLHLAAMLAAERLAQIEGEADWAAKCRNAFETGKESLADHLWTGEYYRSWWMDGKPYPDALHADTLYGQLWAFLLDLGLIADPSGLCQHLDAESRLNASPFGLKVMRRADGEHPEAENAMPAAGEVKAARDNLIWQAGSLDWCSLHLYLGRSVPDSLVEAQKVVLNWAAGLRDQWNYTDLTTGWDGYPWCNSHYSRQLIIWSIPLALAGQKYFAPEARLAFDPHLPAPARLPFFTPTAFGTIQIPGNGRYQLGVDLGTLELRELRIGDATLRQAISLRAGDSVTLPGSEKG